MRNILISAVAALFLSAPTQAATLLYEASFTATLAEWALAGSFIAYDIESGDDVDFDPTRYTATQLGILNGKEIGDSGTATFSLYKDPSADYGFSVLCTGFLMFCKGNYVTAVPDGTRSIQAKFGNFMGYVSNIRIGPDGGFFGHDNDDLLSGEVDGIRWANNGNGMRYGLQLSDVRITMPAPVPLPASALLLGGALALLGAALKRRA